MQSETVTSESGKKVADSHPRLLGPIKMGVSNSTTSTSKEAVDHEASNDPKVKHTYKSSPPAESIPVKGRTN